MTVTRQTHVSIQQTEVQDSEDDEAYERVVSDGRTSLDTRMMELDKVVL